MKKKKKIKSNQMWSNLTKKEIFVSNTFLFFFFFSFSIAGYYLLIPQFAPVLADEYVEKGTLVLERERQMHPTSAVVRMQHKNNLKERKYIFFFFFFFLIENSLHYTNKKKKKKKKKSKKHFWLAGRAQRSKRRLRASAEAFCDAARGGKDFVQIVHVNYYELAFNCLFARRWRAALHYFAALLRENTWSRAFYAYVMAVVRFCISFLFFFFFFFFLKLIIIIM